MARDFSSRTDIDVSDLTNYPDGRLLDNSPASANNGTPISETVYGDLYQLTLKLLRLANLTPNGNADTDSNTQLFSALQALITTNDPSAFNLKKKIIEIVGWNMNTTPGFSVAHEIANAPDVIRSCEVIIITDPGVPTPQGEYLSNLNQGNFEWNATNVVMGVNNGTTFQTNTGYNSTTATRGFIIIEYT